MKVRCAHVIRAFIQSYDLYQVTKVDDVTTQHCQKSKPHDQLPQLAYLLKMTLL